MIDVLPLFIALGATLALALAGWLVSLFTRDVSIVDGLWSLMFLFATVSYLALAGNGSPRAVLLVTLVSVWAIRLSGYIFWRNRGEGEDYRYQQIRKRNSPGFALKSIYIVFGLQAILAWFISFPLLAAVSGVSMFGMLDIAGAALWLVGFGFESIGDAQLARFRSNPANKGQVLDSGLWKYTRHPNYFGEFCMWWGFYLIAVAAGGWWTILSPILMSVLLLKVSGVGLLERDIHKRRPDYVKYKGQTNAFFPGPKRQIRNRETFNPR